MVMWVKDSDPRTKGTFKEVTGEDDSTNRGMHVRVLKTSITRDAVHEKVHDGDFYTVSKLVQSVANDASLELLLKMGSSKTNHVVLAASAGGDAEIFVFEGPTISSNGTGLTAYNNNRSSANTADGTYFHTPTTSADGTKLYEDFIPGGGFFGAGGSDGGPPRAGTELILAVDTNYLIRLTNESGGPQTLSLSVGFYEV